MKAWILFDGRAKAGDTDDATVLEFIGHSKREVKSGIGFWKDHDGVLVEYDVKDDELTNEKIIGHLREGRASLMDRCTFETTGESK